jgi:hypothetical protein
MSVNLWPPPQKWGGETLGGNIMDKEAINQITMYLDKLGEKLGIGTAKIWPWFVRQIYIDVVLSWLFLIVTTVSLVIVSRYGMIHWKPEDGEAYSIYRNNHEGFWAFIIGLLGFFFVIAVIFWLVFGFDFLNPEYMAFKNLMGIFIQKK